MFKLAIRTLKLFAALLSLLKYFTQLF